MLGPFVIVFSVVSIVILTMELITKKEYFNTVMYNKRLAYRLGVFLVGYHIIRLIFFIKNNSLDSILKESIWR